MTSRGLEETHDNLWPSQLSLSHSSSMWEPPSDWELLDMTPVNWRENWGKIQENIYLKKYKSQKKKN